MRYFEFRGKQLSDGEWIYGNLLSDDFKNAYIIRYSDVWRKKIHFRNVDIHTVSQYTGVWDTNSERIFEGDIVRFGDKLYKVKFISKNDNEYIRNTGLDKEDWDQVMYFGGFILENLIDKSIMLGNISNLLDEKNDFAGIVVGNIWDGLYRETEE